MASLWVMAPFFQISMIGPPEHEMLEGYAALAYAAGVTKTITLGTLVTGVTYRHPGLLIKTVTTLDVLSGRPRLARDRRRVERAGAPRARRALPSHVRTL
jgi:alkanesulfonate monooxygenase SsuD/methylene tetrahydromethanopterin reductase-like flavin-dependent oxidoreductase (luciferase family)